jgi:hypothetical protein
MVRQTDRMQKADSLAGMWWITPQTPCGLAVCHQWHEAHAVLCSPCMRMADRCWQLTDLWSRRRHRLLLLPPGHRRALLRDSGAAGCGAGAGAAAQPPPLRVAAAVVAPGARPRVVPRRRAGAPQGSARGSPRRGRCVRTPSHRHAFCLSVWHRHVAHCEFLLIVFCFLFCFCAVSRCVNVRKNVLAHPERRR